jgi:FkbM family methyltransferase
MNWGGVHNSVMHDIGYAGNPLVVPFETKAISFSLDGAIKKFQIPNPSHLKIDVDGLEMEILRRAKKSPKAIKSILIEVSHLYADQFKGLTTS